MPLRISPSLAAAPLDRLGQVVLALEKGGADYIHFDIEDGSFVPVMTLGTKIITDLRSFTQLPFDVHLMMVNPEWILPELVQSGADRVSVHYEACPYPRRVLRQIVSLGVPEVLEKVRKGKQVQSLERIEWVVDGGINAENISQVLDAGADTVVIGRSVFKEDKISENMAALRAALV